MLSEADLPYGILLCLIMIEMDIVDDDTAFAIAATAAGSASYFEAALAITREIVASWFGRWDD